MLAKARQLVLSNDTTLKTPCLVPSFSSRGFPIVRRGIVDVSSVSDALDATKDMLNDAMLLSAYDVCHALIPPSAECWTYPEVLIVDSGGYETGHNEDLSDVSTFTTPDREWTFDRYVQTLQSLPRTRQVIAVSYDIDAIGKPFEQQVDLAHRCFTQVPQHLGNLLLKPTTGDQQFLPIDAIVSDIALLQPFDVIGVTEKELGRTLSERMIGIAKLRMALDQDANTAPIHVFGSLDPLMTPFYYVVGAEVFDGLAWLRYGFHNGIAIYRDAWVCLTAGVACRYSRGRMQMLLNNLSELDRLRAQMRRYHASGDFSAFGTHAQVIKEAHELVGAETGGT